MSSTSILIIHEHAKSVSDTCANIASRARRRSSPMASMNSSSRMAWTTSSRKTQLPGTSSPFAKSSNPSAPLPFPLALALSLSPQSLFLIFISDRSALSLISLFLSLSLSLSVCLSVCLSTYLSIYYIPSPALPRPLTLSCSSTLPLSISSLPSSSFIWFYISASSTRSLYLSLSLSPS